MYTYEIDPADMFEDRAGQFAKFGIPADEIERIRAAVKDMWADAPGGWVYEWSKLAGEHADRGDHYLSSLIYGCAKFPCLTDQARVQAMQHQLEQFQLAAQVETLSGFVEQEQARFLGQSQSNFDALAFSSTQFVENPIPERSDVG